MATMEKNYFFLKHSYRHDVTVLTTHKGLYTYLDNYRCGVVYCGDWGRANLCKGLKVPLCLIPLLGAVPHTIE